ncbi:hypothetical protein [Paenibacillus sp. Y412MC10]|uniref:hypothetical protein n=1 Tax=Geobacillus sp. (strain Y412MC10) TaxID=481743 RepID=UPI0011A680F4|nr:hypothetical protein [Paenibacillus sp. Y412MC10]
MDSNQPPHQPDEFQQNPGPHSPHAQFVPPAAQKHSGPGIASFVMGLVSLLGYIISAAAAGAIMAPYLEEGMLDGPNSNAVLGLGVVGLLMIALVVINVVGTILGIVGTAIRNRKKIFAIIGLIVNAVIVLSIGLFFIYFMASAAG